MSTTKEITEKRETELKAALGEAERTSCKLRAEREGLEEKLIRQSEHPWLLNETRAELEILVGQMNVAQVEILTLNIELLKIELPRAQPAIEPLRRAFEESRAKYRAATEECNRIGADYGAAKLRVSSIESAISSHERTIEELKRTNWKSQAAA